VFNRAVFGLPLCFVPEKAGLKVRGLGGLSPKLLAKPPPQLRGSVVVN